LIRAFSATRLLFAVVLIVTVNWRSVREEVDLLCDGMPHSIFVRHYFSPAIKELRQNVEGIRSFDQKYRKALIHRIRSKVQLLRGDLTLLEDAGFMKVTENCNQVTELYNPSKLQQSQNQAAFLNQWSLGRDLDPRPLPYQGNAPPG
jgi:hypothetical protein